MTKVCSIIKNNGDDLSIMMKYPKGLDTVKSALTNAENLGLNNTEEYKALQELLNRYNEKSL